MKAELYYIAQIVDLLMMARSKKEKSEARRRFEEKKLAYRNREKVKELRLRMKNSPKKGVSPTNSLDVDSQVKKALEWYNEQASPAQRAEFLKEILMILKEEHQRKYGFLRGR